MSDPRPPAVDHHTRSEEHLPSFDECVEYTRQRMAAYFAPVGSIERKQLLKETERVRVEKKNTHTHSGGYAERKHIPQYVAEHSPEWRLKALTINIDRINEDVVRVGNNWHVQADGISNYEQNVCALMGELFALIWGRMSTQLGQMDPHPNAATVRHALSAVPEQARRVFAEAIKHFPKAQESYTDSDFSTTVEAVYYAPWLKQAFVMHIGDSRTYKIHTDGTSKQLTEDHTFFSESGGRTYISSSMSPDAQHVRVDVLEVPLAVGESIASMSDGVFAVLDMFPHEDRNAQSRTAETIKNMMSSSDDTFGVASAIVHDAVLTQMAGNHFDDAACAITRRVQ